MEKNGLDRGDAHFQLALKRKREKK
eukprot:SAG31_NODE_43926_length_265_cov_0.614458_1_plen_24_part_10